MTQPKVSIIIVNWNGLEWLKVCLPSLAKVTYSNLEVIVVDNGSNDGSIEYLRSALLHPRGGHRQSHPAGDPDPSVPKIVTVIVENQTNLGFAYPNNQGIDRATGEFILFLNNDMKYDPGFIEPLVAACQQPGIGAAQPKMVRLDDPSRLDVVGSYLTVYGILYHFGFGQAANTPRYNQSRDIFSAKGAALMVRTDVLEKTKLPLASVHLPVKEVATGDRLKHQPLTTGHYFDADYFAYFEETDLCWRIWLAGYRIRYEPTALVWHTGGATAKRLNIFTHYHSFKNRLATLIKNLSFGSLSWMIPLHLIMIGLASLAYLMTGQLKVARATWRAVGWNLANLPATLAKRTHVQHHIRRRSDRQLWPIIHRPLPINYFYYLFTARLEAWPTARALEEQA